MIFQEVHLSLRIHILRRTQDLGYIIQYTAHMSIIIKRLALLNVVHKEVQESIPYMLNFIVCLTSHCDIQVKGRIGAVNHNYTFRWSLYMYFYNAWWWLLVKAKTCSIIYIKSLQSVVVTDCPLFLSLVKFNATVFWAQTVVRYKKKVG